MAFDRPHGADRLMGKLQKPRQPGKQGQLTTAAIPGGTLGSELQNPTHERIWWS